MSLQSTWESHPLGDMDHEAQFDWPWISQDQNANPNTDPFLLGLLSTEDGNAWITNDLPLLLDQRAGADAQVASVCTRNNNLELFDPSLHDSSPQPTGSALIPASIPTCAAPLPTDDVGRNNYVPQKLHNDGSSENAEDLLLVFLDEVMDEQTSLEVKKVVFGVIVDKVFPYRSNDGSRAFPSVDFYDTLLHNEPNPDIRRIGRDVAFWLSNMSTDIVDHYVKVITEYNNTLKAASPEGPQQPGLVKPLKRSGKAKQITDHQDVLLKNELQTALTFAYRGIIDDIDQAVALGKAYEHHFRQESTPREDDPTWPTTRKKRQAYVKQMYEAIVDTSCFQEKTDALRKKAQLDSKQDGLDVVRSTTGETVNKPGPYLKRKHGQEKTRKIPGISHTDSIYVNPDSTPADLLRAAARCDLSDVEVELNSAMDCQEGWELRLRWTGDSCPKWERFDSFADRWEKMCFNMQNHKVMLHSALRGDWTHRLAAGPAAERKLKINNKQLNATRDIQNQVGRESIKRRKLAEKAPDHIEE
ncbi:hypothetical protein CGMCC3_g12406 [Colletotrichum fructicola]|uniref:Uncharacterized protein n=1 Tax=Colletotrichum fructicola (strain Nara gc5) TaxID=1213859 RepID=L2FLH8_COLFN|nr:uncharacterized protein CGMCC3_g12406 [Colletotrichum fructicola]KAE9571409.1 hypothetical protein CGMCC3_g12406 [Colletotrichum fructicola]KAF4422037.1 hypothetical protein CFRS1_v012313 [Colletotrichum fructicola]KAF4490112.1 hypothetical protein CGGC5_v004585 [Colletotrichum fructicola Nara gc5]KAF4883722.1 hypothetical protein CGCFRS4_v013347 [Colletotrichum fructicola]